MDIKGVGLLGAAQTAGDTIEGCCEGRNPLDFRESHRVGTATGQEVIDLPDQQGVRLQLLLSAIEARIGGGDLPAHKVSSLQHSDRNIGCAHHCC